MIAPPKENMASKPKKTTEKTTFSAARLIVWGVIILLTAAAVFAYFAFFAAKNNPEPAATNKPKAKPVETPKPASKTAPKKAGEKTEEKPKKPVRTTKKGTPIPDDVQPDKRGVLRHPGGLRWVDTNDLHKVSHPRKKQLFKHHSENAIATLLTLDPDRMAPFLVGHRPKFGKRFVEDFKASLYDKDEFPEDDTEEERELRRTVLDVKKDMAAALGRGEDIAKMMNDAQDELDRLVAYKDTLMKQLKEIKNDEKFSDSDVLDFTAAANQMLKSQGLKELATPNLTYRQLMLQRRKERMNGKTEQEGTAK
jgi:hypothetical protein